MSTTRIRAIMRELPGTVDGPKLLKMVLEATLLLLEPLPQEEFIELSGMFLTLIDRSRIGQYIKGLPTGNLSVKEATPLINGCCSGREEALDRAEQARSGNSRPLTGRWMR